MNKRYYSLGLMSGTSLDGIDASIIVSNGENDLEIIDNYGGTPAGNLAEYYAGMAYLNLKNYEQAIAYLDKFKSEDDALAPMAKGAIGDAFMQLNQDDQALDYYLQATNLRQNEFTTPTFLYKAGVTALNSGNASKALELFNKIKDLK